MTTTTYPKAMMDRLILAEEQLFHHLPEQIILVTCDDVLNRTDVELSVYAPGLDEDEVRETLTQGLQRHFTGDSRFEELVIDARIEDGKVLLELNESRHQRVFIDMVLGMMPALLAPLTVDQYRTAYALRESQKLAIVQMETPFDGTDRTFNLAFPASIEVGDPGVLKDYLRQSVQACPIFQDVFTYLRNDQRIVSIKPDWRPGSRWSDASVNHMLQLVVDAYATQVQAPLDNWPSGLVLKLDHLYVDPDDGGDYEQPYSEY